MQQRKYLKNAINIKRYNYLKTFVFAQVLVMLSFFIGCNSLKNDVPVIGGSYSLVVEGLDFGPAVTKIIIEKDEMIYANASDFKVYVVQKTLRGETLYKGERKIISAYQSDELGNKSSVKNNISFVMQSGPDVTPCYALYYNAATERNEWTEHQYTITHIQSGRQWNKFEKQRMPIAEDFDKNSITYEDITMDYAYYTPLPDSKKNPLIIWLHGAGEGGHDTDLALLGNKVVNLAAPKIQSIFDGAYVLVPQCPTMWMDNGTGHYTNGVSKYTAALKNLIDNYISDTPDIDTDRIYIGGCSNGGFMTIRLLLSYPHYFAAAFPVCEAFLDSWITDKEIEQLINVPIWFTHAKNDMTVNIDLFTAATYKWLKEAGAANVHFTCWEEVLDITDLFITSDNQPYEYNGHFSWVYTLNNACKLDYDNSPVLMNGQEASIMEWLAAQTLK